MTECKLEIERAEKIRNSFGYIETGLDINEIYTEDPESPRKVDCENVDTERVKNITEMMRKKNSYNANSVTQKLIKSYSGLLSWHNFAIGRTPNLTDVPPHSIQNV